MNLPFFSEHNICYYKVHLITLVANFSDVSRNTNASACLRTESRLASGILLARITFTGVLIKKTKTKRYVTNVLLKVLRRSEISLHCVL